MWIYQNKELDNESIPDKSIGFLYVITNTVNGVKYLGKKLLIKPKYKVVKGKKKKFYVENDWRDYWGSSPYLLKEMEDTGREKYIREILMFATGRGLLNYMEESLQYRLQVLESDKWFNSNIRAKVFKKNVMKYPLDEMNKIVEILK